MTLLSNESDQLTILLFHGVTDGCDYEVRNATGKHLDADVFAATVSECAARGLAMSMDDVLEYSAARKPFPPRAFAVTFDDGFESNYTLAAPVLKEHGVPATFYVATDFVESNAMSWTDRIEYCLERTPRGRLRLADLDIDCTFSTPTDRRRLMDLVRMRGKTITRANHDALADDVARQCGVGCIDPVADPIDAKMSWTQVKRLNADPLFTVGGHSHSHPILSWLTRPELEREIDTSLELLRRRAGIVTRHYSYPEGLPHCYSDTVIDVLRSRGIECCPTAVEGRNRCTDDPFELRRIEVCAARPLTEAPLPCAV